MQKHWAFLIISLTLLTASCGGGSSSDSTDTDTQTTTSTSNTATQQAPVTETKPSEPKYTCSTGETVPPIVIEGEDNTETQIFELKAGLSVFKLVNASSGHFSATLYDSNGKYISLLANHIGLYTGSKAVNIEQAGSHKLTISSSGSWSANITQPRPTESTQKTTFSALGDMATDFFLLEKGIAKFNISNPTTSSNSATLLDVNGKTIDLLTTELSSNIGSAMATIPTAGCYLLNMRSGYDKAWSINMSEPRPSSAPNFSNISDSSYKVPEPFSLTAGTQNFYINHQGDGHFSTTLYNKDGDYISLLASKTTTYTGTVAKTIPGTGIYFLEVKADPDATWTIGSNESPASTESSSSSTTNTSTPTQNTSISSSTSNSSTTQNNSSSSTSSSSSSTSSFGSCGTKTTCGQMLSCAEAMYYLNSCGVSRLDGNSDGTPCESICN